MSDQWDKAEEAFQLKEDLKAKEYKAAQSMNLGPKIWILGAIFLLWLISLFLPFTSTGIKGIDVLLLTDKARSGEIRITEYVYIYLITLGPGVFNGLLLLFRKTIFSWIAWMFSCVGTFYVVLALWLRQTTEGSPSGHASWGMYLSILPVIAATVVFSMIILKRDPEQLKLAQQRRDHDVPDYVALNQREELKSRAQQEWETNPLLVDDRRAQAHRRHQHH
ncbi:hypothetical protein GP475_06965 [Corynebacterium poyangense]|uniref:Uncharacterized protein n=1 Tax=Corynebacterium poyangense TaxID=2684405 RepID=A0A7H0SPC7_9CORY|nr:hypothetical protein [Corynebacterium poyangense]MBZ8177979.1 hypothetical protein [Corynebacterium poyangense]QNQ90402.1 hypothetical protein GP475_06965 [Corynebacterium poyangense]